MGVTLLLEFGRKSSDEVDPVDGVVHLEQSVDQHHQVVPLLDEANQNALVGAEKLREFGKTTTKFSPGAILVNCVVLVNDLVLDVALLQIVGLQGTVALQCHCLQFSREAAKVQ